MTRKRLQVHQSRHRHRHLQLDSVICLDWDPASPIDGLQGTAKRELSRSRAVVRSSRLCSPSRTHSTRHASMPPGRAASSKGKQRAVADSSDEEGGDSSDYALKLPKYGQVEKDYLNQPINNDLAAAKCRTLIAELGNARKDLFDTIAQLRDVAILFATNEGADDEQPEFDNDNIPEDSVSLQAETLELDRSFGAFV